VLNWFKSVPAAFKLADNWFTFNLPVLTSVALDKYILNYCAAAAASWKLDWSTANFNGAFYIFVKVACNWLIAYFALAVSASNFKL
jgi:hypothetical protein